MSGVYSAPHSGVDGVASQWLVIDGLVRDIGALAADVHMAERTLATDPRTHAARSALDRATDAVCVAIDETSQSAATQATHAISQARAIIDQLGLTMQTSRNLVAASRALTEQAEGQVERAEAIRGRVKKASRARPDH